MDPARSLDAGFFHAIAWMRQTRLRGSHSDDRNFQIASFCHRIEPGKIILWARSPVTPNNTSESEREVVMRRLLLEAATFSTWPPNA